MLNQSLKITLLTSLSLATGATTLAAQNETRPEFEPPVRIKAAGEFVKVEAPGYAAPCWADVDADGQKDLVVGQFKDGKMRVYRNLGRGKLAKGEWLEAAGEVAVVPGVW